ncbi:unnamed protein product [Cylicocyclus nassatus]|uniref:Sodium/nucleoside cotransporter n=1 Tax=Cylicocyclus nassatus TaxID=53992 RepID=A0AA36MFH4_CYLNA|nr:unnamed protein product [Cylicocyclus nassatus]
MEMQIAASNANEIEAVGTEKAPPNCAARLRSVMAEVKKPSFLMKIAVVIFLHIWAVFASIHNITKAQSFLILLALGWILWICHISGSHVNRLADSERFKGIQQISRKKSSQRWILIIICGAVAICFAIFLVFDTSANRSRLYGLAGIAFFVLMLILLSNNRRKINWRIVVCGYILQLCLGMLSLRWKWFSAKFHQFAVLIVQFLELTNKGSEFVYGFAANPPPICEMAPVFLFSSMQVLVFFSAIVSLLYYYGIIQWVLGKMASCMEVILGTTAVESLNACACVILGQSEGALLVKPYLERQTASELHAIMTSGLSCIAGSLFAAYVSFGACPEYLLSSSVMSAPGSLACSKIMYPEVEESQVKGTKDLKLSESEESSPVECITNGSVAGLNIVMSIGANLVAVLALLGFVDSVLFYLGDLIGSTPWSLELILGYVLFPVAFLMGVTENTQQTLNVARLIGTKIAVNEFVAYKKLGEFLSMGPQTLSPRSAMIGTYALCSFANFSTIGIILGVMGGLAPSKKQVIAKNVFRALLTGCICSLFTATLAGILVDEPNVCNPSSSARVCFSITKELNASQAS